MENRYTAILLAMGLATCVIAQPNLPTGSISFAPGESYLLHQCAYFTPPGPGVTNAVWDHSDLVSVASFTDQFVAPPTGGPAGSTVAEVAGTGTYVYYKASAAAFEQMGLVSPQATMSCANPVSVLTYPFEYGGEMLDTYSCGGNTSGFAFSRNGTMNTVGTSWGTLILPYGTFTNVLMIMFAQNHQDIFPSNEDYDSEYQASFQLFVKPGVKQPLLSNYQTYSIPGPFNQYSRMLDASSVGVQEAQLNAIGVDMFPNPAQGSVEMIYGVVAGSTMNLEILDMAGKVVLQQDRKTMVTGIQREVFDIANLAPGVYTVRVTDAKGASGTKRLVVQ